MKITNIQVRNTQTGETKVFDTLEKFKEFFTDYELILDTYNKFVNKTGEESFFNAFDFNWNSFRLNHWEVVNYSEVKSQKRNKKTKQVGNGEGSLYKSEKLGCLIYQYYDTQSKRQTIKQRKNETTKEFKARVTEIKNSLNNGTYIRKSFQTIKSIAENYINQKFKDGLIKGVTHFRDKKNLQMLEKCCSTLINEPIQEVTMQDLQMGKENMKNYSQSTIDKFWQLLKIVFAIASSPSTRLIPYNLMIDENLKKPISNKLTKKVYPLTYLERQKLKSVLDNEERSHPYRNIVKMEWITGMRIGEVLARSRDDIDKKRTTLHIHNTMTIDENGNFEIGKHTKTYDKKTDIDYGERNFPISIDIELKKIIDEELSKKITNIYGLLFYDYENNSFISYNEINSWLDRINKKYKISNERIHNHRLRHDRITQWKESNMDIKAIQYLAGHVEDSNVTDVYIDVSQEYAFEQYRKAKKQVK